MNDELEQFKEFAHEHSKLLLIAANPSTDEIMVTFNDKHSFVRFPQSDDITKNIVFRMLFDSLTFKETANQFIVALMKGIGVDEKHEQSNEVYNVIGGSLQKINEEENVKV